MYEFFCIFCCMMFFSIFSIIYFILSVLYNLILYWFSCIKPYKRYLLIKIKSYNSLWIIIMSNISVVNSIQYWYNHIRNSSINKLKNQWSWKNISLMYNTDYWNIICDKTCFILIWWRDKILTDNSNCNLWLQDYIKHIKYICAYNNFHKISMKL